MYLLYLSTTQREITQIHRPNHFHRFAFDTSNCPLSELHRSHANKDWNSLRNMEFESQTRGFLQRSWDYFISTPSLLKWNFKPWVIYVQFRSKSEAIEYPRCQFSCHRPNMRKYHQNSIQKESPEWKMNLKGAEVLTVFTRVHGFV